MKPRLPLLLHLPVDEIRRRYLATTRPGERTRWHAIWLLADAWPERSAEQVAALVGRSAVFVRDTLKRFNARGPDGLIDARRHNRRAPKLTTEQRAELFAALQGRPPDGGLWSGPKVAAFVRARCGVQVRSRTGWDWLRKLGFPLKVPGPRHPRAAGEEARRRWLQSLSERLAELRRDHPDKAAEVWVEDEARLGLKPIARRVWALKGQRPRSNGQQKYQSLYVHGFAEPRTGRNLCLILPKTDAEQMGQALREFAAWADPRGRKVLVVLLDNAGWHIAGKLVVPANVELFRLPACTPELQPAERLWPLLREALANEAFADLAALEATLRPRLEYLAGATGQVQKLVGYHWALAL